jgi:hypothetical protein
MYIELEVKDREGRLLRRKKIRAQSWVGNMVGMLSCIFSGITAPSSGAYFHITGTRADLLNTNGSARGIMLGAPDNTYIGVAAGAGVDSFGILVGTSSTPVVIGQYNLGAKISHGTGLGQLSYGAVTVEAMTKDTTWYFRVIRTFTNNSGAGITVYEVGLFIQLPLDQYTVDRYMLARDVISGGVVVPAGASLTVRYTISHSV